MEQFKIIPNSPDSEFRKIPLDLIDVSRLNARQNNKNEGIDELANSIKQLGLLSPVMVYKQSGRYVLIAGQRRYLAFKKLAVNDPRYKEIPALVTEVGSELDVRVKSFTENIQRRDISYRDKMQTATVLMSHYNDLRSVSNVLGVTVQTVKSYLGYSAVPEEIKILVDKNELSAKTAVRIFQKIDDESLAISIAKQVKEYPTSYERRLAVSLIKKYPDKSAREIKELVTHIGPPMNLHFEPSIRERLKRASTQFDLDEEDIIAQATEEWLDSNNIK